MRELNIAELKYYRNCLQNTWDAYTFGKDSLSASPKVFAHLHKRYKNIQNIIERKQKETFLTLTQFCKKCTYHIVEV